MLDSIVTDELLSTVPMIAFFAPGAATATQADFEAADAATHRNKTDRKSSLSNSSRRSKKYSNTAAVFFFDFFLCDLE